MSSPAHLTAWPRRRHFDGEPHAVGAARRFARGVLAGASADVVEAVELMVSELATNAIRHAHSDFRVGIARAAHEVRVEVSDASDSPPRLRHPGPDELSGRGLQIVDRLADAWGVERPGAEGKTVWFVLAA